MFSDDTDASDCMEFSLLLVTKIGLIIKTKTISLLHSQLNFFSMSASSLPFLKPKSNQQTDSGERDSQINVNE